ncbi:MAG: hypothetical protein ABSB63_15965 [Spirochaetia bacterium]
MEEISNRNGKREAIVEFTVYFLPSPPGEVPIFFGYPESKTRAKIERIAIAKAIVPARAIIVEATGGWKLQSTAEDPHPEESIINRAWKRLAIDREIPAEAGRKSIEGGNRTVKKRFGSEAERQKERARWQAEVERQCKRLCREKNGKRPSHLFVSKIVGQHFKVKEHTIRRYTRLPSD